MNILGCPGSLPSIREAEHVSECLDFNDYKEEFGMKVLDMNGYTRDHKSRAAVQCIKVNFKR